ncbi:winged helix-turn-helix transcriptional regulator [Sinorhizobium saheli]|jgi:two-component system phosphate regulon response regulator PhoB|uniref:Transcriptional regulator n=1 Tax=Sinorhizobium saheli TaxID=36856 RepID=A0A178YKM3_SINSA|nr:response regulator transcription factor [Sinorhizobium saheli]MQW86990.1 DNA-binding response regulator [Sinorhizobium saheli]OAP48042.1 transcriptional regulator [Sinorhizobium saheli]
MRAGVLIYTGDAELFRLIAYILAAEGFPVRLSIHESELLAAIRTEEPLAVLVDCSDCRGDAVNLCRRIREVSGDRVPVAVLTNASRAEFSRDIDVPGIDAVICSPYDPRRLLAFLKGIRTNSSDDCRAGAAPEQIYRHADIEMNVPGVRVTRNGHAVYLSALQFRLLLHLMKMPGIVHSRDDLIAACWPRETEVEPRTVDIHIGHIRRALNRFGPDVIRTVRSVGYALDDLNQSLQN